MWENWKSPNEFSGGLVLSVLTLQKLSCLPTSHSSAAFEQYDFQQIFYSEEKTLKKSKKNVNISIPLQNNIFPNKRVKIYFRL